MQSVSLEISIAYAASSLKLDVISSIVIWPNFADTDKLLRSDIIIIIIINLTMLLVKETTTRIVFFEAL